MSLHKIHQCLEDAGILTQITPENEDMFFSILTKGLGDKQSTTHKKKPYLTAIR